MTITISFSSYNARRYGRPWVAKVTAWPVGSRATLDWGTYLGDASGGETEIEANSGDVVRYGQKDNRGNNSSGQWAIVQENGTVQDCTEAEAARAYRAIKQP